MLFRQILMILICVFFIIGITDHYLGGRFGIGQEFKRAYGYAGTVILTIVGIISLSPVLAAVLRPVVIPVFQFLGADAAMFAPTILSPDCGGYSIAMEMASDPQVGAWAGTVVAAHLGGTFSFNIPLCVSLIDKKHHRYYSLGALSGIIASPFGCILGGILAKLPISLILSNMVPALIVSFTVVLGLLLFPEILIRCFLFFGRVLTLVFLVGLTLAVIERLTGIALLPGMNPLSTGMTIAGTVVSTMAGIFCLTYAITKRFKRQLLAVSRRLRINETSFMGIFNGFCAILPGCYTFSEMDSRGKVLFSATTASSSNIFGAHLGFIGTAAPAMLMPSVAGKLFSGLIAVVLATLLSKKMLAAEQQSRSDVPQTAAPAE